MEKYEEAVMEVVELEGVMETFSFCTPDTGTGSVHNCGGGMLSHIARSEERPCRGRV